MRRRRRLLFDALALGLAVGICATSPAHAQNPRVPAGLDPGGIAVAIIGAGVDYTLADLARRLARDGEGDLIGWDLADNDARPFATGSASDTGLAALLLEAAPRSRLIAVRVAARQQAQIAAALRFLAQTPARVVLVVADPGTPLALADLAGAARQLPHLVIVVPARRVGATGVAASHGERGGLLVVRATGDVASQASADVAAETHTSAAAAALHIEDVAAVRVAGLVAGLASAEPAATGAVLRERLIGQAHATPGGARVLGPPALQPGR